MLRNIEYISSIGVTVILRPVSPELISGLVRSIKFPDKPTYTVTLATGETEVHEHDQTTLETDEDRKAWDEYQAANQAVENELFARQCNVLLNRGVVNQMPQDDGWIKRQNSEGITDIPTEPRAKRLYWILTELLGDENDTIICITQIRKLSVLSPEVLAKAGELFLNQLAGNTAGGVENPIEQLENVG